MSNAINPTAPHHLPLFITAPGETDPFLVGCAIFLVLLIVAGGVFYFKLHALPEHLAHKNASKLQFEIVAVLALIALFTHTNWLWVVALLLALIPMPNLYEPLAEMAASLAKVAGWRKGPALPVETPVPSATTPDGHEVLPRSGADLEPPNHVQSAAETEQVPPPADGAVTPPKVKVAAAGNSAKRARPKKERAEP